MYKFSCENSICINQSSCVCSCSISNSPLNHQEPNLCCKSNCITPFLQRLNGFVFLFYKTRFTFLSGLVDCCSSSLHILKPNSHCLPLLPVAVVFYYPTPIICSLSRATRLQTHSLCIFMSWSQVEPDGSVKTEE